jgi:hypothetical protein
MMRQTEPREDWVEFQEFAIGAIGNTRPQPERTQSSTSFFQTLLNCHGE